MSGMVNSIELMFGSDDIGLRAGESLERNPAALVPAPSGDPVRDQTVPDNLDSLPPGAELAAVLAALDPRRLTMAGLIAAARAYDRHISRHQAQGYLTIARLMDELHDRDRVVTMVASVCNLNRRQAEAELDHALALAGCVDAFRVSWGRTTTSGLTMADVLQCRTCPKSGFEP